MKRLLLTLLLLGCTAMAHAQKEGKISATVIDRETGETVPGAVVAVTSKAAPEKTHHQTSDYKGGTSFTLPYGEYTLTVEFLGYEKLEKSFKLAGAKMDLGKLELRPGVRIEAVVKEAKAIRASQKGDTISYNASAFKVASDSDVEGLLKKMQGITVKDGTVEAQGETVKKIFVDGKEFFGEDVTTAIKSLPAETVDRIEVYNKLSDAAEFSGMDDGEGYKALNIVTHKNMRQGQFGRIYAGVGYDAETKTEDQFKYLAGGNINFFNGDSRVSLLGLFNNVNQQNFSFEDILGVSGGGGGRGMGRYMTRPQSGVAKVNAFGINYSDTWGKNDQVTFQGSYFFNNTNTVNRSTAERWTEAPNIDTLSTVGYSETASYNHRFNGRLEWKISKNQSLMLRPSFSFQSNDPNSSTNGWQWGSYRRNEAWEEGYTRIANGSSSKQSGYRIGTNAVYRAKLGKDGRTITVNGGFSYADNSRTSYSTSNLLGYQPVRPAEGITGAWTSATYVDPETGETKPYVDPRYLTNLAPSKSHTLRGEFTYTEPLSKYSQVSLQYRVEYDHQERDKKSYETGVDYSIEGLLPSASLSSAYRSDYTTHRAGPGFRYSKNRNSFVANISYQYATLSGRVMQTDAEKIHHSYNNLTYFMMGQLNINREHSLRLYVSSYTQNPSVSNLQSIFDLSDAQKISSGNPDLNPTYSHSANFHYNYTNIEKGRTFMWMFNAQVASDVITSNVDYNGTVTIDGKPYSYMEYSRPINMNGSWSVRTFVNYGFPISFLKSNFNLSTGLSYSISPSQINGQRNDSENMGYNFRALLGSNISENVDFTLSWNGNYNIAKNSIVTTGANKNRYFFHSAEASMKFVLPLGFTFTASASYTQNLGFTDDYNDEYILCNLFVGKKVFKNRRGEILLGVNDLFNQNKAFVRSTGSGWTQNATNSVIGRYYMVQFTYNLRLFGKKGSRNMKDYDYMETPSQGRRMGPGHGGPAGPPPGGFRPR